VFQSVTVSLPLVSAYAFVSTSACVLVMLCYVIWLFVKRLSQEAIQRRSQRDRLVKISLKTTERRR